VTLRANLPDRCVLDGEIVIAHGGRLDFEAMLLRIHPAASRVAMLAAEKPASYVAWDLLALGDEDLRAKPQQERRDRLVAALADAKPPVHVTPATRDKGARGRLVRALRGRGARWRDGQPDPLAYTPGKRAMLKIKHQRTADCVIAGFRWYKGGKDKLVGSLLLGLYDAEGRLHHVGVCAGFKQTVRAELAEQLKPLRDRTDHPWKDWARLPGHRDHAAPAGRDEPVEPRQGSVVGAAQARARVRGLVRLICRARGFATARTSSAGGPTNPSRTVATISSKRHPRSRSHRSSAQTRIMIG